MGTMPLCYISKRWRSKAIYATVGCLALMILPKYQISNSSNYSSQLSETNIRNINNPLSPVGDSSLLDEVPLQHGDQIVLGEYAEPWVETYIQTGEIKWWSGQEKVHILGDYVLESTLLSNFNGTLTNVQQFFDILSSRQRTCRRMIKQGGGSKCKRYTDGDKPICLDPGILMPHHKCLVYSFGVGDDLTFEDALIYFKKCEIHMFDPTTSRERQKMFVNDLHIKQKFHNFGLGEKNEKVHNRGYNVEYLEMKTLDQIQRELGHVGRSIHYLKIDIEGTEWEVLPYLLDKGLLNNVYQISMELHTDHLKNKPYATWLPTLQEYLHILRSLEKAGFQRVHYEENWSLSCFLQIPHLNVSIPVCGEVLYIRSSNILK